MNLLDKIRYTNRYPHISRFIIILNLLKRKPLKQKSLPELCKEFKSISALASGPSLNKCRPTKDTLFLTTNSSYLFLNYEQNFVHFIRDIGYLLKFLLFGLKNKPLLVVIDIYTFNNGKGLGSRAIVLLNKYLGRRRINYPIVVTSNENNVSSNEVNYSNEVLKFMTKNNLKNPNNNSGLMIYGYGVWLTQSLQLKKECNIFGLDAGEGGQKYFNNIKTLPNHVAMRDKNKEAMGNFIESCQNNFKEIFNYSYFKNNI